MLLGVFNVEGLPTEGEEAGVKMRLMREPHQHSVL